MAEKDGTKAKQKPERKLRQKKRQMTKDPK
jgi:hypothetical protein